MVARLRTVSSASCGCSLCDYQQYFLDFDGDGLVDLLVFEDLSNHTQPPAGSHRPQP